MPDSPSENKPADNKENMERHFFRASASDFKKIPGSPIAYWVSMNMLSIFSENPPLEKIADPKQGLATMDNDRFLKSWYEVSEFNSNFNCILTEENNESEIKWYPVQKGGEFRKWFGNNHFVINWKNGGQEICDLSIKRYGSITKRVVNREWYFKQGLTFSRIGSGIFSVRYMPDGFVFETAGCVLFPPKDIIHMILGYLNSTVAQKIIEILAPTLTFQVGDIAQIPVFLNLASDGTLVSNIEFLIKKASQDWNSYETSWNFASSPLIYGQFQIACDQNEKNLATTHYPLPTHYTHLRSQWQQTTLEMQRLEEENNRIFIEAYGLQDELTPEVPLKEITLTCNPHYRYGGDKTEEELEALLLADTMKEYISYAVGCMLGRYSIDKPGLILANQGETLDDYVRKVASDQGLVVSDKEEGEKSCDCEKLQGAYSLAKVDGLGGRGLSDNETIPKGRNLQLDQSASQSSCINSVEYSRGTGSSIDCGVQELSVDSSRFSGGSGNSITDSSTAELPDTGATFRNHDNTSGSKQNASGTHEQTNHSPLTTNHLSFLPDEDNVIPILDEGWFSDDITERFKKFLKVTFGEENYEINLKFIEDAIGKDIRKYFLKDFYSDHVKRYKKRPIYWFFSSPKGSFNALIYMHRYQPDTASLVLNEYLREFRAKLSARKEHQEAISISSSASQKEKTQALKDIEKLKKTIEELDEYEREILYPLATRQISIDLDDGVKVNYLKFGAALKKIPGLDAAED